jgi:outer membrane protein OmpA-like peptidoglycan-associated protein
MKFVCTIFIMLIFCAVHAQQYDPGKVNKKATKLYQDAMLQANDDHLKESIKLLEEAVKIDKQYMDAWLSIAGMNGQLKNYGEAVRNYEIAMAIDTDYFRDYNLPYAIDLAGTGAFEKALDAVKVFLSATNLNETSIKAGNYRKRCFEFAVNYKKDNPGSYLFEPKNLGDSVNTAASEYWPTITIDGKKLIFTRLIDHINEDFYETGRTDTAWTLAKPLKGFVNTNANEAAQTISQDGRQLIFTGCNYQESYGACDLYISYLTPDGWSAPENLGDSINTEFWESGPSLSPDKKDLYFSSNRSGGYGGSDIYVSHLLKNGRWSSPENLGPEINTAGDEYCPFIHADNQTLYFSSNAHEGYGGSDLYMVRKQAPGKWSVAKNLGYPINTIEDEGNLVVTSDGTVAYYASDRSDSRGGLDLYTFGLRPDIRPIKTLWVKGKVFDKKTARGLPSAVELADLKTKEIISTVQTDETGNYLITLPVGKDYAFNVNRRGYLFFSDNFPLSQRSPDSTYNIDIPLQPLEANATIILKNIFFDVNKYELKTESQVELGNVVKLMKENPTLKIQINGHTDNMGKPADNITLSNNRAKAVVEYITSKNIDAGRLSFQGFGDKIPLADNKTEEGRAQNRRTELKVTGQ